MVNSVKLNDGGQRFVDAEFVLGVEPRKGGVVTPWFLLDASGKDKGHRDAAGATGRVRSGALAARARRSSSTSTATAISTSSPTSSATLPMVLVSNLTEKTRAALPRSEAHRHHVESQRAGRGGQGHCRRVHVHEGPGRQLGLPVAQPVPAVLRARSLPRRSTASRSCGRRARSRSFNRRSRSIRASTCASSEAQDKCRGSHGQHGSGFYEIQAISYRYPYCPWLYCASA